MPHFRFSEAAELLGISDDTVRRWVDQGRLAAVTDADGRRVVEGATLAAFAQQLARQHARQPGEPAGSAIGPVQSARNRLRGIVTKVIKDTVMAQVEMQAGPYRLVSLMSREAADQLGLEPGVLAVASVKSTNVVVEVADSR